MKHCAIYIRKSREDKDPDKEAHRLVLQRESLPAYALSQGWKFEVYDDGYASAGKNNLANLKERARLESDIRARKINVVLVLEFSRISRDDSMEDYARFIGLCREYNVKLTTPTQTIDPTQTNEWLLSVLTGTLSAAEMQVLKARMAEGRAEAKRKGKWLGGILPAPYRQISAGKLEVEKDALKGLRKIWRLSETTSAKQVAAKLGLPLITVRRAISDDRLMFYQALRIGEDGAIIQCDWPPCMDAEQAERIKDARKGRYAVAGPLYRKTSALLTGLNIFRCGYCGLSIHSMKNGRRDDTGNRKNEYYGCRAKITKNACPQSRMVQQWKVDERVITNILGALADLEKYKAAWREGRTEPTDDAVALDKEELDLTARKKRLVLAIAEGVIDHADARETREQIDRQLETITRKRSSLTPKRSEPDWKLLEEVSEAMHDPADRRKAISLIVKQIRMFDNYLTIEYNFALGKVSRIHLPPPEKGKQYKKSAT